MLKSTTHILGLLALCVMVLATSCKEPILSDEDLLTSEDNFDLSYVDTLPIVAFTEYDVPLIGRNLSNLMLGITDDPTFGEMNASFYTELALSANDPTFGSAPYTIDSVVLSLKLNSFYGDVTEPHTISVYQLMEAIGDEVEYPTDTVLLTSGVALGTETIEPNYNTGLASDSITAPNGTFAKQLRISLNSSLGSLLLAQEGTGNLDNNEAFQAYFKGIHVVVESGGGKGFMYLSPTSDENGITVYYRESTGTANFYTFPINSECTRISHYVDDYAGSTVEAAVASADVVNGDERFYVGSMSSVRGRVIIGGLEQFENIAINKAELIVTQIDSADNFETPEFMIVFRVDDDGNAVNVFDFSLEPLGHLDGFRRTTFIGGEPAFEYRFNISRYAQRIVDEEVPNNGLYLLTFPSNIEGDRVILGGNHPDYGIRFEMTYTKID